MWNTMSSSEYRRIDSSQGGDKRFAEQGQFVHDVPPDRHSIRSSFTSTAGGREMEEHAEIRQLDGPAADFGHIHRGLDQIFWESGA